MLAMLRTGNKKDQRAPQALRDFVAKVPRNRITQVIRLSPLAMLRTGNKKDQRALQGLRDFVAKVPRYRITPEVQEPYLIGPIFISAPPIRITPFPLVATAIFISEVLPG